MVSNLSKIPSGHFHRDLVCSVPPKSYYHGINTHCLYLLPHTGFYFLVDRVLQSDVVLSLHCYDKYMIHMYDFSVLFGTIPGLRLI